MQKSEAWHLICIYVKSLFDLKIPNKNPCTMLGILSSRSWDNIIWPEIFVSSMLHPTEYLSRLLDDNLNSGEWLSTRVGVGVVPCVTSPNTPEEGGR